MTRGLFGGCPGGVETRGTFLRRLLGGCHPQTNAPLRSSTPRPVILDAPIARADSKRRVVGKQIAGSDSGEYYCMAGRPDHSSIDDVVSFCGFTADLEARDTEYRSSASQVEPLEADVLVDGL